MIWLAIAAYIVYACLFGYYIVDDKEDLRDRFLHSIITAPLALVVSPIIGVLYLYYLSLIHKVKRSNSNVDALLRSMNYSKVTPKNNYDSILFESRRIPLIIEGEDMYYTLSKAQRVYMNMRYSKMKKDRDRKKAERLAQELEVKAGRVLLGKPPKSRDYSIESHYLQPEQ